MPMRGRTATLALLLALFTTLIVAAASAGGSRASAGCTAVEHAPGVDPDVVIASDFALHGYARRESLQIVASIRDQLKQRSWKAGSFNVGLRSCDDSTAALKQWSGTVCLRNGDSYAADPKVVGVIGTYNSGCAALILPTLSVASIPMVSPVNTYLCLSRPGPGCVEGETQNYQPQQKVFYRVSEADDAQAAAIGQFVRQLHSRRVVVLDDGYAYGRSLAIMTSRVLKFEGIASSRLSWNPGARSYPALWRKVGSRHPDLVILSGLIEENGGRLIRDKVAVLGPNDGAVRLLGTDGFAYRDTVTAAGRTASKGMLAMTPGGALSDYTTAPAAALRARMAATLGGEVSPYVFYGAQSAALMLDALGRSDGTRAGLLAEIRRTDIPAGKSFLGTRVRFDYYGDIASPAAVSWLRIDGKLEHGGTIKPNPAYVRLAGS